MGYPAATGRGTSFAHRRNACPRPNTGSLPAPQFLRNFAAPEGRRCQLSLNRDEFACFLLRAVHLIGTKRSGGTGGRGESLAQKHGTVCADRLAKQRTARASGVFPDALNLPPMTRESPLRQSADWKTTAVGLLRPQILELKGWEATFLSSRVE